MLGDELTPYLSGRATLRFAVGAPLSEDLIRRVAAARLAETAAAPKKKRPKV